MTEPEVDCSIPEPELRTPVEVRDSDSEEEAGQTYSVKVTFPAPQPLTADAEDEVREAPRQIEEVLADKIVAMIRGSSTGATADLSSAGHADEEGATPAPVVRRSTRIRTPVDRM